MSITYIVRSGDTLWRIAQRLCGDGTKYAEIIKANNIVNPDLIYVGQNLIIPCKETGDNSETVAPLDIIKGTNTDFVEGIDVSVWQGNPQWNKITQTNKIFAIARATFGTSSDTKFQYNWHNMELNGVIRGAYHYFQVFQDATEQAEAFLSAVTIRARDLPPVLDVELAFNRGASQQMWINGVKTWLDKVKDVTGRTPIIYTSNGAWGSSVNSGDFEEYPLWVANWNVDKPLLPKGWKNWYFWQYSETGKVSGIQGNVDLDKFNGSRDKLDEFISLT